MPRRLPSPPLLLITDRIRASRPLADVVAAALDGGCRWVSLREKDLPDHERRHLAEDLLRRARPYNARIGVHEDVALAANLGLRTLHLPSVGAARDVAAAKRRTDPRCLIGRSCHSVAEVEAAAAAGADYATLSPIFPTASKPGYGPALGVETLAAVAAQSAVPLLALGGLSADRLGACRAAGAKGAAVMGEVMRAADPARVVRRLIDAWQAARLPSTDRSGRSDRSDRS